MRLHSVQYNGHQAGSTHSAASRSTSSSVSMALPPTHVHVNKAQPWSSCNRR
jgi:hypothetical protein